MINLKNNDSPIRRHNFGSISENQRIANHEQDFLEEAIGPYESDNECSNDADAVN